MPTSNTDRIRRCAKTKLGIPSLRPEQVEAIASVLDGRDTLVVQPTGSGKSAIYQTAGLLIPGTTVVISPLLALQRDQLETIAAQPHDEAADAINSAQGVRRRNEILTRVRSGELEYVFVAPEQLRKFDVLDALDDARVSLLVVDEAHCISEWGHDFRPDYLRLGAIVDRLGHPVTIALTATASRVVRDEIVDRLHMRNPNIMIRGLDRPNIKLRVDRFDSEEAKLAALLHRVRWAEKPGIVYVATRRAAEMVARALRDDGLNADFYHAGMSSRDREEAETRFFSGEIDIIVATNAFGMGIDKSDVRFVFHYDLPESLDSYYQEVGRAGRDGNPADAVLFFRTQNAGVRRFQAGAGKITEQDVRRILDAVSNAADPAGIGPKKAEAILQQLTDAGAIAPSENGYRLAEDIDLDATAQAIAERSELLRSRRKERLQQMLTYAALTTCRREFLLRYFDDEWGACVNCDNCGANAATSCRPN